MYITSFFFQFDSLQCEATSEESCSEDLEEEDDVTAAPAPPIPACLPPPSLFASNRGIMLEFGRPHVQDGVVEGCPVKSTASLSSELKKTRNDADATCSEALQTFKANSDVSEPGPIPALTRSADSQNKATRSLKSAVRKKALSFEEEKSSVQDVLEAMHAENAMLDGTTARPGKSAGRDEMEVPAAKKTIGKQNTAYRNIPIEPVAAQSETVRSLHVQAKTEASIGSHVTLPTSQHETAAPQTRGKASNRHGFPIKPVLLDYNISRPSRNTPKPMRATPTLGSERSSDGNDEGSASHSMTEHTLKVITGKVRNMNSR